MSKSRDGNLRNFTGSVNVVWVHSQTSVEEWAKSPICSLMKLELTSDDNDNSEVQHDVCCLAISKSQNLGP